MRALVISAPAWRQMVDHAEAGYPHEVVGVLAGDRAAGRVCAVHNLLNERADSPKNRYHVGPLQLARAEEALEAAGHEIVGYYHSHPDHPAIASEVDRDHALPSMAYPILAVALGVVQNARLWWLRDDGLVMVEQPMSIESESGE